MHELKWKLAAMLLAVLCPAAQAQEQASEELVQRAADGNRAAINAIRTISCRYSRQIQPQVQTDEIYNAAEQGEGRYWRTPEIIRVSRQLSQGRGEEILVRQGRVWALTTTPTQHGEKRLLAVGKYTSLSGYDVWNFALFTHFAGGKLMRDLPFADMLDHTHRIVAARKVNETGRDLVYVKYAGLEGVREFWFDPAVNYLVRKSTFVPDADKSFSGEWEVTKFIEPTAGIYFPAEIEQRGRKGGRPLAVVRTTISDLIVNRGLSDSQLRLAKISGMVCYDSDRQTDYRVDAEGNRNGPETPTEVMRSQSVSAPDSGTRPIPPSKPPWPLWLWILLVSLACLVTAAVVRFLRQRASRAQIEPSLGSGGAR